MKNIYLYISFGAVMLFASCSFTNYPQNSYNSPSSDVTYQQFYNDLSPYGDWVDYQGYGYVWVPNEQGFRPYYNNGHWIYTDYGWTWVSNYNWGWAPFHYGRWMYDYAYGWMWVPGYQWAPAWVSWRSGGDYYGWAPLSPGMNINAEYASNIPDDYWSFVPSRYINSSRINNYYVNRQQNVTIINNTTVINNTRVINNNNVYITGPSASDVERNTHERIRPVRIVQINRPGDTRLTGDKLAIYRPVIKEVPQTRIVKPDRISNLNEVKLLHQRNGDGYSKFPAGNDNQQLNSVNRVQEPVNTQKNNLPLINNRQREIVPPQKTITEQRIQPNAAETKQNNQLPPDERLNRARQNQIHKQEINQNLPVQTPQPYQQNNNKKNDQFNSPRFQNPNDNQPALKNIPPPNIRNMNRSNENNPVIKQVLKPSPYNERQQNNIQPARRNVPVNRPAINNVQPKIINENSRIILPQKDNLQNKEPQKNL